MKTVKPILFSAPMIRAILEGRKTQTRRIIKPQPSNYKRKTEFPDKKRKPRHEKEYFDAYNGGPHWCWWDEYDRMGPDWIKCPYGSKGGALWVRENFWHWGHYVPNGETLKGKPAFTFEPSGEKISFKEAACVPDNRQEFGWHKRPSIFMPRWASRITLEIKDISVERLNDISEADVKAEGIEDIGYTGDFTGAYYFQKFTELWESINGADSWQENPYVWVVEFEAHNVNIDKYLER